MLSDRLYDYYVARQLRKCKLLLLSGGTQVEDKMKVLSIFWQWYVRGKMIIRA